MPTRKLCQAWSALQSGGASEIYRAVRRRLRAISGRDLHDTKVLLITNRDSDNVGDQVIEECARSLVKTALADLGIKDYRITSRAAGMITKRYLATHDTSLLAEPEQAIAHADLIVFGGSPLFNYRYQPFYERTATTLELAQKHGVPAVFSAIGIEDYDALDERCQRLKSALALPCVKQITTRDNYEALQHLTDDTDTPIAKVADPAVLADLAFRPFVSSTEKTGKVGLFVIREHAFRDNAIDFTREQAASLWVDLAHQLEARGIDYEFVTSGHFSDEAFMELLVTDYGIPASRCQFNMNAPEDLVQRIASYDALASCRLHPSIIAYSLGVPSVALAWNDKVPQFYEAIGRAERVLSVSEATGSRLATLIEQAMREGISHDDKYRTSAYTALRAGIARALKVPEPADRPTETALAKRLIPFAGTSEVERQAKIERKFRRTYDKFNLIAEQNTRLKQRNTKQKATKEHADEQ